MTGFVMVPREPAQEMVTALREAFSDGKSWVGMLEDAIAAAPPVAAEPVADPFMGHEALHTAHLARDFVHNNLIEHSFVAEDPALLHFAEKAADALRDLYQGVAEKTLYTHPKAEPVNRRLLDESLDLLDEWYSLWEDGDPAYEEPDEFGGFMGHAVNPSEELQGRTEHLLRAHRPRAAITSAAAQPDMDIDDVAKAPPQKVEAVIKGVPAAQPALPTQQQPTRRDFLVALAGLERAVADAARNEGGWARVAEAREAVVAALPREKQP